MINSFWDEERDDYTKGIIGLRNNNYYCYMNSVLQCFVNLTPLREFYLGQQYADYKTIPTILDSFDFSNSLYLFYKTMWRQPLTGPGDLKYLKEVVQKKFCPIMMHDGHEFLMYTLANLQDEGTPKEGSAFDGSDPTKPEDVIFE